MKKFSVLLTVFVLAFSFVNAAETNYAGEAMSIGVGARPLGMGGTFAAIADDASTSYWNAAGMTNVQGVEVSSVKLSQGINNLDTKYSYVNLVWNTGESGAFGLGWLRQAIGGIRITDINGITIGDLKENADNTIYLAYAYPIMKGFSLGASGKALLGNYPALTYVGGIAQEAEVNYTGFGLDIGAYLNVAEFAPGVGLSLGINIQDVFTSITWEAISGLTDGFTETVGLNLKPGIAYKIPVDQFEITAAADVDTRYEQLIVHAGAEIWWNKMVAIRGGIKNWGEIAQAEGSDPVSQAMDWSIGASLRWYFIGIDYAFVSTELAGETPVQYLSIIGEIGRASCRVRV